MDFKKTVEFIFINNNPAKQKKTNVETELNDSEPNNEKKKNESNKCC